MHTQPQQYPVSIDILTPQGSQSVKWTDLCAQLGIVKAKALLQSWERTMARAPLQGKVGMFVSSSTYGCQDYWQVTNVCYKDSLVNPRTKKQVAMEATWSRLRKALQYKLF